jgi:hypothetical protein
VSGRHGDGQPGAPWSVLRASAALLTLVLTGTLLAVLALADTDTELRTTARQPLEASPAPTAAGPGPVTPDPQAFAELGLPPPPPAPEAVDIRPVDPPGRPAGTPGVDRPLERSEPRPEPSSPTPTIDSREQTLELRVSRLDEEERPGPPPVVPPVTLPPRVPVEPGPQVEAVTAVPPRAAAEAPARGPLARTGLTGWALVALVAGAALVVGGVVVNRCSRPRATEPAPR